MFFQPADCKVQVELWDCGGGEHQSGCWPAIQRGAQVFLFVNHLYRFSFYANNDDDDKLELITFSNRG